MPDVYDICAMNPQRMRKGWKKHMLHFECDYACGAAQPVLDALVRTNGEQTSGYGEDLHCERARALIRQLCRRPDAAVHFVTGGTQANLTVIAAALRPFEGVLCADTGHINVHETGAVEATGHKVLPLPGREGKITAAQVRAAVEAHRDDATHEHMVRPALVYISHPTELGTLYSRQADAAAKILEHDIGVLCAATAFGKTAVGAYLIAQRKVNTLVLVHNSEIMKNWVEDFEKFLQIDEDLPEYITPKGRRKKRKSVIGTLSGGRNTLGGILDVAMITSLGQSDDVNPLIKNYGMVIMDECHHAGAAIAEDVLNAVNAKYVYGLTATPKRDDGQEQKIFMQFGPIRYRYTAKDRAVAQNVRHFVYPRFTRLFAPNANKLSYNQARRAVVGSAVRNELILTDVVSCLQAGRTPLVLTKEKEHAAFLYAQLKPKADHTFLLQGGSSARQKEDLRAEMRAVPPNESVVLVAIGQYIGEGFNFPRLDTMMLTMPISWQGNVEQYAGRLHRDYEGKRDVIIYDYVDAHIRVLESMYYKRLRTYKRIGYEILTTPNEEKQTINAIFDSESYLPVYEKDLMQARKSIYIASPGLNKNKVRRLIALVEEQQTAGVIVTVITQPAESYPQTRVEPTKALQTALTAAGIYVVPQPDLHTHFAVIDQEIVWYGSTNLLSRDKEDDGLMRIGSRDVALELLEEIGR